jgi:hypothetical protein
MSTLNVNTIRNEAGTGAPDFPNGVSIPATNALPDPDNRIINGAFDFWQRGTSSTSGGYATADRWRSDVVGGTVTTSRQSFAVGDTLGFNSPTFFARQAVSGQSLSSHAGLIQQRIEGVRSYAGETITILGWARRSSGTGNVALEVDQFFGSGGSPSAGVTGTGQTITLTGSWAAFAVTVAVPSITGKTLGTNGDDFLSVNFWTSAGSNFNARTNSLGLQTIGVDLWGIHIKRGTHTAAATEFYKAPELGPELARCQRYFTNLPSAAEYRGDCTNTNFYGVYVPFPEKMRVTPSVSLSNDLLNGFGASFTSVPRPYGTRVEGQCNNTGAGRFFIVNVSADAEL